MALLAWLGICDFSFLASMMTLHLELALASLSSFIISDRRLISFLNSNSFVPHLVSSIRRTHTNHAYFLRESKIRNACLWFSGSSRCIARYHTMPSE